MTLQPAFIGIPLAFDWPFKSRTPSTPSGTESRIQTCHRTLSELDPCLKYSHIVVTASTPPNTSMVNMCEQQAILINHLQRSRKRVTVHAKPCGWGTESEIKNSIALIKEKMVTKHHNITLVIATNSAHMWRVRLLVSMYKPKRWKCVFAVAKHNFSLWSHLREIPATLITLGKWVLSKDNI